MIPRRSKTIVDVNLSTDEVRERIMHIMVRIWYSLINNLINIFIYQDDLSEDNETKEKMFQGLTSESMRTILILQIQREDVSFIEILS